MRKLTKVLDIASWMLLWLVASVFLWGFVFNILTDTEADRKMVLYADVPVRDEAALARSLEKVAGEGIEIVKVRAFTHAMMYADELQHADLYIVRESQVEEYLSWFAPLPEALQSLGGKVLTREGVPLGVRVWDSAAKCGAASSAIAYGEEDCYLLFGASSLHLAGNENAVDGLAIDYALHLLTLQ